MVDSVAFCDRRVASPASGRQHALAALGVFSAEANAAYRRHVRASWLAAPDASDIKARFVMRGLAVRSETLHEARAHGDTLFVRARSELGRSSGPLVSLVLWYQCAISAWPRAQLIGKADDDVWADLPRITHLLRTSLDALQAAAALQGDAAGAAASPRILFGELEQYSWDDEAHRPTQWGGAGWWSVAQPCTAAVLKPRELLLRRSLQGVGLARRRSDAAAPAVPVTGPFVFPKGPMYFVSRSLVEQILADRTTRARVDEAVAAFLGAGGQNRSNRVSKTAEEGEIIRPWEDVVTGLALAIAVPAGPGLALVHLGCTPFTQTWGLFMSPSTALWHMRAKSPERIAVAHEWAQSHGCTLPLLRMHCTERPWRSCSGAEWRRCFPQYNTTECSTRLTSLLGGRRRMASPHRPECWTQAWVERQRAGRRVVNLKDFQ